MEINPQIQSALDALDLPGTHLFITGRAGTGKSTLLRHLTDQGDLGHYVVLAPTGVAAINVGGETIHHFFGFRPGITRDRAEAVARSAARSEKRAAVYRRLETMIIDEVSMVRADLLDIIDTFLQKIRSSSEPFGGVRLLAFGDLHQLPPVVQREERELFSNQYYGPHFFDSQVITSLATAPQSSLYPPFLMVELEKIYRQSDDDFIDLLNAVRNRTITAGQIHAINERHGQEPAEGAVHLTTTNASAREINALHLEELPGTAFISTADVSEEFPASHRPTDEVLELKPGSRVMLLTNDAQGRWVNGTLGTLLNVDQNDEATALVVELDSGETVSVPEYTWEAIHNYWDEETDRIDQKVVGTFTQFPVRLAWAMTIHKSQGKTFPSMVVDFGRSAFAHGQVYVALSRCTSLEGLVLTRPLRPSDIRFDPRVNSFMNYIRQNQ